MFFLLSVFLIGQASVGICRSCSLWVCPFQFILRMFSFMHLMPWQPTASKWDSTSNAIWPWKMHWATSIVVGVHLYTQFFFFFFSVHFFLLSFRLACLHQLLSTDFCSNLSTAMFYGKSLLHTHTLSLKYAFIFNLYKWLETEKKK